MPSTRAGAVVDHEGRAGPVRPQCPEEDGHDEEARTGDRWSSVRSHWSSRRAVAGRARARRAPAVAAPPLRPVRTAAASGTDFLNGGFPAPETPIEGRPPDDRLRLEHRLLERPVVLRHLVVVLLLHGARPVRLPEHRQAARRPTRSSPTSRPTCRRSRPTASRTPSSCARASSSRTAARSRRRTSRRPTSTWSIRTSSAPPAARRRRATTTSSRAYDAYTKAMTDSKGADEPGHLGHHGRRRPDRVVQADEDGRLVPARARDGLVVHPARPSTPHKVPRYAAAVRRPVQDHEVRRRQVGHDRP